MFKKVLLIVVMVFLMGVFVGCESDPAEEVIDEPDAEEPVEDTVEEPVAEMGDIMGRIDQPLSMDGSSDGYPNAPIESAGASIYLAYDDDFIYVLLEAEVEGWLSVGINESGGGMNGANMVLGYLTEEGEPAFRDDAGVGRNHSEAGVTVLEQPYFDRSDGTTVLEFAYPIAFPADEGYNVEEILPGETYSLIVGLNSSSDDINNIHSTRGMVDFQVQP